MMLGMVRQMLLLLLSAAAVSVTFGKEVWIGTSPFCEGDPRDCPIFDMEFIRSDKNGDGKYCLTGTKVLCRTKQLGKDLIDSQDNELSVVSYNIFERPFFITHDGQTERTCHIPRAVLSQLPETDIIIFQEAFLGGCWYDNAKVSMKAQLSLYGFPFATEIVGTVMDNSSSNSSHPFFIINGGVFIASRWPIVATQTIVYSDSGHADRFSKKGAVYAKVVKGARNYHIFGTHMQAQPGSSYDKIRVKQGAEIRQFVTRLNIPNTEPVLIGGDLNCDNINNPTNVVNVLDAMSASLTPIVGDVDATLDPAANDVVEEGSDLREWLDYVVYSRSHRQPKSASQEALRLTADQPITYCNSAKMQPYYVWPWSKLCGKVKTTRHLSDHFPVIARFVFE